MTGSYRSALRAKGIKPMTDTQRAKLRTRRELGDVEIIYDPRVRERYRTHRHAEEQRAPAMPPFSGDISDWCGHLLMED